MPEIRFDSERELIEGIRQSEKYNEVVMLRQQPTSTTHRMIFHFSALLKSWSVSRLKSHVR